MQDGLYLDTARLGKMSPRACNASIDLTRYASEHGCDPEFSKLLRHGFSAWPEHLQCRYPGLAHWNAVHDFKRDLKLLGSAHTGSDVLLASRSASLMSLAGKLFTGTCSRVLLTDCTWPAYLARLQAECERSATELCQLPIRSRVLRNRLDSEELVALITNAFITSNCDGLFLPLVDNLGIRLPIERITESIRQRAELRFVVVDGAQAAGHVALELHKNYCDFLLTGSHKWLRAFATMGIGFYGNPASVGYVSDSLDRFRSQRAIDDPLLDFSQELETGTANLYGETVQVAPLFIASAAVIDALEAKAEPVADDTSERLAALADGSTNWKSVRVDASLQSRIYLARRSEPANNADNAEALRGSLKRCGVTATAYHDGTVRLSMPHGFSEHEWKVLESAFSQC